MQTVAEITAAFGGPAELGRAIGVTTEHAAQMRRRNSVPVRYWPKLIEAAAGRGVGGLTYEALVKVHSAAPTEAAA